MEKAEEQVSKDTVKLKHKMPKKKLFNFSKKQFFIFAASLLLISAILVFLYLVFYEGIFYGNSLKNRSVLRRAEKTFSEFPGIKNLNKEDREKIKKDGEPQFLAGYVTGYGPNKNETEAARYLLGDDAAWQSIAAYIKQITEGKTEAAKSKGYYEGYIFYFWYGRTIIGRVEGEDIPGYGDPKALEEDRNYAKSRADEIVANIKNNKITPQKALETLESDKRLKLSDEVNGSIQFNTPYGAQAFTNGGQEDDGRTESVDKVLYSINEPGLSDVGVIVADPGIPKTGKKEVAYFAIYIDKVLKGQKSVDFYNSQLGIAKGILR